MLPALPILVNHIEQKKTALGLSKNRGRALSINREGQQFSMFSTGGFAQSSLMYLIKTLKLYLKV